MVQSYANFVTSDEVELTSDDVLVDFPLFDAIGKDGHKFVVYEFLFEGTNTTALTESDVNILTGKSTGTVADAQLTKLPTAGGTGTTWFSLLGIIAFLGSAYFVKKKQTD